MINYSVLAASVENTVVSEYTPEIQNETTYQSEADLEKEFIKRGLDKTKNGLRLCLKPF